MISLISSLMGSAGGILVMLAVVAAIAAGGAYEQHKVDADALDNLKAGYAQAQAAAEAKAAAQQKQVDQTALAASAAESTAQTTLTTTLHEELANVPIVKTVAANCVPYGFVRVLDAAVTSRGYASLALPAGKSDDACAPTSWAAVERSVISNYYTASANAEQLNRLIGVLQAEQKAMQP